MLRIRGIPTWVDRTNLRLRPSDQALQEAIWDSETAGAILYMTPEIEADDDGEPSAVIRELEVPEILLRAREDSSFVVILVALGGLSYGDTERVYGATNALANLAQRNMLRAPGASLTAGDATAIAKRALSERLIAVGATLSQGQQIRLTLDTRGNGGLRSDVAIAIDWSERFDGRHCDGAVWEGELIPALCDVRSAIRANLPGRATLASGVLSIPAALLLGVLFSATSGLGLTWLQQTCGTEEPWSLSSFAETGELTVRLERRDLAAQDIALLTSITQSVRADVSKMLSMLPPFRAIVDVDWPERLLLGSDQAAMIATSVRRALVQARDKLGAGGTVHVFPAVPAGLAVLMGQNLNTFLPIQTYEHDRDAAPSYRPAFLLREEHIH